MRDPRSIALHLEAWGREELDAQARTLELLEDQEQAALEHDLESVQATSAAMEALGSQGTARARRRDSLLAELAAVWNVPPSALTLASVSERLGAAGQALRALRTELRSTTAAVLRHARRVGLLLCAHRRIAGEVVELLLTDEQGRPLHGGGALVDAEA